VTGTRTIKQLWTGARLLLLLLSAGIVFIPAAGYSANLTFDHITTGFPLTGLHARVDCESCHVAGIFKGTPRECRSCHARGSRISATVPPEDTTHNINQQTECGQCHRSAGWTVAHFEHLGITSGCNLCHVAGGGGRPAPTDPVHSQIMGADCSDCHNSTQSFTSASRLDHSGITSGCGAAGCHASDKARARNHAMLTDCQYCHSYPTWDGSGMNHDYIGGTQCRTCHVSGGGATAAPADQLHASVSNQACSDCHATDTFTGATIDHSLIVTGCAATGCHASDRTQARNHAGLSSCEACHLYPNWSPVHTMNHSAVGATLCKSCHTVGGLATTTIESDPTPPHPDTSGQGCSSCHSTVTFAGARVDHTFITTGCGNAGCHDSDKATATNHASLTSCESCHHFPDWLSVNMNHSATGTTTCKSCHVSGSIASTVAPNDAVHQNIGSQDCNACHSSTSSFANATVDHSLITTGCAAVGCHAADKTQASNHAQLNSCESCHIYPNWSPVLNMNHTAIGATQCKSCHVSGGLAATAAPNDQFHANIGAQDCNVCHATDTFTGATVDHSLIVTGCAVAGCHATDRTQEPNHAGLNSCESCHLYPNWSPVYKMNHSAIGATLCQSCHTVGGLATTTTQLRSHAAASGHWRPGLFIMSLDGDVCRCSCGSHILSRPVVAMSVAMTVTRVRRRIIPH